MCLEKEQLAFYVLDVFSLKTQYVFCVEDCLCILLEMTLFLIQTFSNVMPCMYVYAEIKNTKLGKCFRNPTFKFRYLVPQANLLELQIKLYFYSCE